MNFEEFTGYILIGGKSSRMGTDKAFLEIGDKNFVENAIALLKPICADRIKIVLNPDQNHLIEKLPKKISHIFDIYKNRGALGGIHASLKDCKTDLAIIFAVDLPFVTTEAIKILSKIALESNQISAIIPMQIDERPQPLCGIYRKDNCLPKLENLLQQENSTSVRLFLGKLETKFVDQNKLCSNSNLFENINTMSKYEKINHFRTLK